MKSASKLVTVWAITSQIPENPRYPIVFHLTDTRYGSYPMCGYGGYTTIRLPLVVLVPDSAHVKVCRNCQKQLAKRVKETAE